VFEETTTKLCAKEREREREREWKRERETERKEKTDFDVSKCVSFHMFFSSKGNEDVQTRYELDQ
jgi:hypothetical protein